jgi:hypothetical protein
MFAVVFLFAVLMKKIIAELSTKGLPWQNLKVFNIQFYIRNVTFVAAHLPIFVI